ncbi:hypothetical protein FGO68_gene6983 [Halteria grandinella]|uniref:EF-hand domain-containing protein n=1 Tax=Halteria grandinella TaxID=5974 RepID=A0A8J8T0I7_HALGN|nr:hypothetical protein FGO68_gene6983 [Halteria grandinella]
MDWNKSFGQNSQQASKSLIDKTLENSLLTVFHKIDTEGKGSLNYEQFEQFLRLNCFDFILDFFDKSYLQLHLFTLETTPSVGGISSEKSVRGRVSFPDIMKFIDDCSSFKNTRGDYKASLGYFTRGAASGKAKANMEDIKTAMRKYTDMNEKEIEEFASIHDLYDLIETVEGEEQMQMLDIEESSKLMYKY